MYVCIQGVVVVVVYVVCVYVYVVGYVYVQHICAQVVICVHRCGMCVHRSCAWCMCMCGTVCEVCVNVSVCWSIKPEA